MNDLLCFNENIEYRFSLTGEHFKTNGINYFYFVVVVELHMIEILG